MRNLALTFVAWLLLAGTALAMDINKGFNDIPWGAECDAAFRGEGWMRYRAFPLWDNKAQYLTLSMDEKDAAKSKYTLRYDKDGKTKFEEFTLRAIYYGCGKTSGKFAFVAMRYSLTSKAKIEARVVALFGQPTRTTVAATIWDLPEFKVQMDQNTLIILARKYAEPGTGQAD
ncbi:MAG: hypothetical protein ACLGQH_13415 [Acidobacteriota bacterium]